MILCLEPHILGSALAAWLSRRPGFDVVIDPSTTSISAASPSDVVVSWWPVATSATVVVVPEEGNDICLYRSGGIERFPYRGLEHLVALITDDRAPPSVGAGSENRRCG